MDGRKERTGTGGGDPEGLNRVKVFHYGVLAWSSKVESQDGQVPRGRHLMTGGGQVTPI